MNTISTIGMDRCSRTYGDGHLSVAALRDVTLHASAGEFVAIMGPSGSGKSTVLNLMSGLDDPTDGQVTVGGLAMHTLSARERARLRCTELGIVFQRLNLVPQLTAEENVMLPLELSGASAKRARSLASVALERVNAGHVAGRFPDVLSGGEQQRVAIARAIVGERKVILADEPTASLDSLDGEAIVRLLRDLAGAGTAVIMVSHDPRWAAWADRIVTLRDGSVHDTNVVAAARVSVAER